MQTLNALCVLLSLLGVGALTAGWLIIVFSSFFTRHWLDGLISIILPLAPIIAYRRQHWHAFIMLCSGSLFLALGFAGMLLPDSIHYG
ncbi:hypothetical protein L0B52_02160 [Suttonella sp. R2A3]|uniref:hypothetical protein n=1 Tax=Suttonella sp. R2A3 TaxID=2908648 RepID=UPI001F322BAD|nr:hypothetical protein [Suttonella sp. R2A3]UJF24966.1 hypothetical protein L0B52_02160 [Suttonella sp. R2A3]